MEYQLVMIDNTLVGIAIVIGIGFALLSLITGAFLWAIFTKLETLPINLYRIHTVLRVLVEDRFKFSLEVLRTKFRVANDSEGLMLIDAIEKRLNPPKKRRKRNAVPSDSTSVA